MADVKKKHRVIGIRHVLRHLKKAGLVEADSHYAPEAVTDIQAEVVATSLRWYKIGAKRGALEVLDAFLEGKLRVRKKADGSREIIATVDAIEWRKRIKARVGSNTQTVKEAEYKLTIKDLGFE